MMLAAKMAELSPWTGMQPTIPRAPDPFANVMQGGMSGGMMGMNIKQANQQQAMNQAIMNYLRQGGNMETANAANTMMTPNAVNKLNW